MGPLGSGAEAHFYKSATVRYLKPQRQLQYVFVNLSIYLIYFTQMHIRLLK